VSTFFSLHGWHAVIRMTSKRRANYVAVELALGYVTIWVIDSRGQYSTRHFYHCDIETSTCHLSRYWKL